MIYKILWHSNTPPPLGAPAGYSVQTAMFVRRLQEAGYDMAISSWMHRGSVWGWKGIPIYPAGSDVFSNDVLLDHADHFFGDEKGLIVTLVDNHALHASQLASRNVASFAVVDTDPISERLVDFYRNSYAFPIAYSRFGEGQLKKVRLSPFYIPHAVDTEFYRPMPKDEARASLELPQNIFLVGVVAANKDFPSRKALPEILLAFKRFRERHESARLYLHTLLTPEQGGVDLERVVDDLGLGDSVYGASIYQYKMGYPNEHLRLAYNAMDVLLNPSYAGAFEVPVVEALACGTPAIVNDSTAMPEHVREGETGWITESQPALGPSYAYHFVPRIDSIVECMGRAYDEAEGMGERCRQSALKYDIETVFEKYALPAFEQIGGLML